MVFSLAFHYIGSNGHSFLRFWQEKYFLEKTLREDPSGGIQRDSEETCYYYSSAMKQTIQFYGHETNYTILRHLVSLYLSFLTYKMKYSHFLSDIMLCYCDVAQISLGVLCFTYEFHISSHLPDLWFSHLYHNPRLNLQQ